MEPRRPRGTLGDGDLLPDITVLPPGPRSRELSATLQAAEAPGINTLGGAGGVGAAVVWERALGSNVLDVDGNRYLDLTAGFGVAAVGHRHPRVTAAVTTQTGRLLHGLGDVAAHPPRVELARRLQRLLPVDHPRVHYAVSGADAVEVALKSALLATGRPGIVAFRPSYHGVTLGALAATSRPAFREPFAHHLHSHVHRLPFACDPREVERAVDRVHPAAVILEPIVGREGVLVPPDGWLRSVATLCGSRGVLLVADEIFTGFGRTGHLFAVDHEDVRPDLVCCGKSLGGGLPVAATVGRSEIMTCWDPTARGGVEALHTATHLANPPACAAALAVLDVLEEEDLPARARRLGAEVERRLGPWPGRFEAVREVRGRGLLWGVACVTAEQAGRVVSALRSRGVLALAGGPHGDVLQIVPPLTITEEQLDTALGLVEGVLGGD